MTSRDLNPPDWNHTNGQIRGHLDSWFRSLPIEKQKEMIDPAYPLREAEKKDMQRQESQKNSNQKTSPPAGGNNDKPAGRGPGKPCGSCSKGTT